MANITEGMEEDARAMERIASVFEVVADTLVAMLNLQQQRFDREYPARNKRDAVVTHLPTEEEKLKQEQGQTDESLDEWMSLGPRERMLVGAKPDTKGQKKRSS